jgi:peptidoglycan/LPS O-acetylase OafA/YrhL
MASNRQRIFYLDFIRAVATVAIILTHYNAIWIYNVTEPKPKNAIITLTVSNIYIGSFGVSLFFIISGAALMYVYDSRFEAKSFYKKRFLSIYPMFWIAYICAAAYRYAKFRTLLGGLSPKTLIFSFLGIDSYLANYGLQAPTLVGEWFIAVIIMMYCVFPLLRIGVQKKPKLSFAIALVLALISTFTFGKSIGLCARIPEFMFGMLFMKYIKKVNWKMLVPSAVILVLNGIIKPAVIPDNIQTFYVGIASFLVLTWLSQYLRWKPFRNFCKVIGKYSYACFLVHHFIIYQVTSYFDLNSAGRRQSCAIFLICLLLIMLFSWALFQFHAKLKAIWHEENNYI